MVLAMGDIISPVLTATFWLSSGGNAALIAKFMGPASGPSGADRTQVGPCWPHELCYLGLVLQTNFSVKGPAIGRP